MAIVTSPCGTYQGIRRGAPPLIIRSTYCQEAKDLFSRMTVDPSIDLKKLIDKTIRDLKDAKIWDITDKLHKWDLHTTQASLLDWKNATNNATAVNSPTFTPKSGVRTTTSTNYIILNITPSTAGLNATLNNTAFSLDSIQNLVALSFNFGSYNTSNNSYLVFRTRESDANQRPWLYINSVTQRVYNGYGQTYLFYNERPNNNSIYIYRDAVNYAVGVGNNSVSLVNQSLILGGYRAQTGAVQSNNINTSTFWMGSCMSASQRAAWYNIIAYWKANIGGTF